MSSEANRARLVGINHVAIEVGDIDEALAFYGRIFNFTLRGRSGSGAFIDMGDQFLAMMQGPVRSPRSHRHFGVVVDDRSAVRALAEAAGATMVDGPFLDFLDPWGNRVEVVEYANVQFTKAEHVMDGMGVRIEKSEKAIAELAAKGMAPKGDGQ